MEMVKFVSLITLAILICVLLDGGLCLASLLALAIFMCVLDEAIIRQCIVLIFALGFGIQEGWEAGSFEHAYSVFIGVVCVVGFLLSPFLWACFGLGVWMGHTNYSEDD